MATVKKRTTGAPNKPLEQIIDRVINFAARKVEEGGGEVRQIVVCIRVDGLGKPNCAVASDGHGTTTQLVDDLLGHVGALVSADGGSFSMTTTAAREPS